MPMYEVSIYNKEVRKLVKEGERHKDLSDDWADTHYIEINAPDESSAKVKVSARYPKDQGYVISSVTPIETD
jgi:hypothetical protein